jgi:ribosome-associated toxin RatA of RatAB toxin-antitoxin module
VRTVRLRYHVPARTPDEVYATLSDLRRYPALADAVRSVTVTATSADVSVSSWEVSFRSGILRWVEEDRFDPAHHTIEFRQLEGDIAVFDGSWQCRPDDGGTEVVFDARLDMGIPSLADALEPIAARTLAENTTSIMTGLFGATATLTASTTGVPAPAGSPS